MSPLRRITLNANPLPNTADGNKIGPTRYSWKKGVSSTALIIVFVVFIWSVRSVLPPFLIAFFLAGLLNPLVVKLESGKISRLRAVAIIYITFFITISIAGVILIPITVHQITELGRNVGTYSSNLRGYTDRLTRIADEWYLDHEGNLNALGFREKPSDYLNSHTGVIAQWVSGVLNTIKSAILTFLGQVLWLIIIPLALFYFLLDFPALRAKLISLCPPKYQGSVDYISRDIVEIFSHYIRSLAIVCLCYGGVATLLFMALGLRYPVFLGLASGVLYAVPYVGPAIAFSGAVALSLTTGQSVLHASLTGLSFVVMHVSFDYGVTPKMVGGSVGLHPLVNIFALMCGATLFGIWGMLLAVPCAATIQMLLFYFYPAIKEKPKLEFHDDTAMQS